MHFAKQKMYEHGDKAGKYLAYLTKKKADSGFIKCRNSCNNMRRSLSTIQLFHQQSIDGLVISIDAEKAFDRVEWPYLLHTLSKFGLGKQFIR